MSGWHIYNNSFFNCTTGTFIGGGSYNLIHDNYYELVRPHGKAVFLALKQCLSCSKTVPLL